MPAWMNRLNAAARRIEGEARRRADMAGQARDWPTAAKAFIASGLPEFRGAMVADVVAAFRPLRWLPYGGGIDWNHAIRRLEAFKLIGELEREQARSRRPTVREKAILMQLWTIVEGWARPGGKG